MERFDDKVAVITGGAGSIGRTVAYRFAAEGAKVVISDMNSEQIDLVIGKIKELGAEGLGVVANLRNIEDINRLAETAEHRYGHIDILVNSAGGSARKKMHFFI